MRSTARPPPHTGPVPPGARRREAELIALRAEFREERTQSRTRLRALEEQVGPSPVPRERNNLGYNFVVLVRAYPPVSVPLALLVVSLEFAIPSPILI